MMRKLAYLLLSLIITVCVMRELAYNLDITKPRAEGWMGILYDWTFYAQGSLLYNYIDWIGAIGAIIVCGVMRRIGSLDIGRVDPSTLDVPHLAREKGESDSAMFTRAFKTVFPNAQIEEA